MSIFSHPSNPQALIAFQGIQEEGEELLWSDTPHWWGFWLAGGGSFLLLALGWSAMSSAILYDIIRGGKTVSIGFMLMHNSPLIIALLNVVRLLLVHGNTFYAFSNRRILWRGGFFGTDFRTLDFDQITEVRVTVNPLEKLIGRGTLRLDGVRFVGVGQPYEVMKFYKQVSLDNKTDWQYPNAKRPAYNPGYQTKYRPRK